MKHPRIGITTYGRNQADEFPLPANYVDAVLRSGGLPLLIPPGRQGAEAVLGVVDGLLLTGGGDIDHRRYGGRVHDTLYMVDHDRDGLELALAEAAIDRGVPLLAICRGVQIVNVMLGGSLFPHVPDVFGGLVDHRLPPREPVVHPLRLAPGSWTAEVLEVTECEAMSWHHQAIDRPGPGLTPVAWAPDDVVEAVEMSANPNLLALQWHPELTAHRDPIQQRPFDWLVERSKEGEGEAWAKNGS